MTETELAGLWAAMLFAFIAAYMIGLQVFS